MTGRETKIVAVTEATGRNEFRTLAMRLSTTPRLLAETAVGQLLVAAESGDMPAMAPLDLSGGGSGVPVWLDGPTEARLKALGEKVGRSPEDLAGLAVRHLLAQARAGATLMLKPLEAAPEPDQEPSSSLAARVNFSKAKLIVDRLHHISQFGFSETSRTALIDLETIKTIPPY